MAKDSAGRKFNRIPGYVRVQDGKKIEVKPHIRSNRNDSSGEKKKQEGVCLFKKVQFVNNNSKQKFMYQTGEKPGKGWYRCVECNQTILLDDYNDTLPPCPKCHKTTWIKIG